MTDLPDFYESIIKYFCTDVRMFFINFSYFWVVSVFLDFLPVSVIKQVIYGFSISWAEIPFGFFIYLTIAAFNRRHSVALYQ